MQVHAVPVQPMSVTSEETEAIGAETEYIQSEVSNFEFINDWRTSQHKPVISRMKKHSCRKKAGLKEPLRMLVHYTWSPRKPHKPYKKVMSGAFNFAMKPKKRKGKKVWWGDIPYHYYIRRNKDKNSESIRARSPMYQPDTNTAFNTDGWVNFVVEVGVKFGKKGPLKGSDGKSIPEEVYKKDPEVGGLIDSMVAFCNKFKVDPDDIRAHNDVATTSCPGKYIAKLMPYIRGEVKKRCRTNQKRISCEELVQGKGL